MTTDLAKIETELAPRAQTLQAQVSALVIRSHQDAETMAVYRGVAQELIDRVHAELDKPIAKAHEAHKVLTEMRARWLKGPEGLKSTCNQKLAAWDQAERQRREEERCRLEAEERRRQEAAAAEVAAALESEGRTQEAEAVLEEAIEAPVTVAPPPPPPRISGVAMRESWDFRIKDPARVARQFLVPDEKAIRALVTRQGPAAINLLGGPAAIEVFKKTTVAGRR